MKTGKRERKIFKKVFGNERLMDNLFIMTDIFNKLNDKERIALNEYHNIIESNAMHFMFFRCLEELAKVMHAEELKQFEKEIRKQYKF